MKLKKLLNVIIFLSLLLNYPVFAGYNLEDAKSLSQKWFEFAEYELAQAAYTCLALEEACLESIKSEDRRIRARVLLNLIRQLDPDISKLIFVGNQSQTLFHIDGAVRVAATEKAEYSAIYINLDLLYKTDTIWGDYLNLSLPEAVSILLHEKGHQWEERILKFFKSDPKLRHLQYEYSHDELDQIGAMVSSFIFKQKKTLKVLQDSKTSSTKKHQIYFEKYNFTFISDTANQRMSSIYLLSGNKIYDINALISQKICGNDSESKSSLWHLLGYDGVYIGDIEIAEPNQFESENVGPENSDLVLIATDIVVTCKIMAGGRLSSTKTRNFAPLVFNFLETPDGLELDGKNFHYGFPYEGY